MIFADKGYRERNGKLEYRFTHNKKQFSVVGETKKICGQKRLEIMKGKIESKVVKTYTVGEWLDKWAKEFKKPKYAENSYLSIENQIKNHIKPEIGNIKLKDLTTLQVQTFLNSIKQDNTRNKVKITLNDAFKKAVALPLIKHNPCTAVEIKTKKKKSYPPLSTTQQKDLYTYSMMQVYRNVFMLCCCTGLRPGEALGLKVSDIDFKNNIIEVQHQKNRKGELTDVLKTDAAYRSIPFLPELFKNFDLSGEFVVNTSYAAVDSYLGRMFEKLEYIGVVWYSFRHTFVSNCYHIGINIKQIQEWAGHADVETTLNIYTHLLKNNDKTELQMYLEHLALSLNLSLK